MVVKYFKYILFSLKLNLKKEMEYKTSFILKIVMMIANNAFYLLQWVVIFGLVDSIGGYGFKDVMLLWAITSGSYGVMNILFNGVNRISDYVHNGKLDSFLTQPKNVLLNVACSSTDVSSIGDALYAFVVLVIIGARWYMYLLFIPLMLVSGIILAATLVIFNCFSFYIKRGDAVAEVYRSCATSVNTYPPTIFNNVIKIILYTVLPIAYVSYVPLSLFMEFSVWSVLIYFGSAVLLTVLAFVLFNRGLKRYNSSNVMSAKM